jgi:hypothetical protein
MPYIWLASLIFSFASGFGVSRSVYSLEIEELKQAIAQTNAQAQVIKDINEQKLLIAKAKAIKFSETLDKSHESYIKTVNAYSDKFKSSKLYDNKASCRNKVSKSYNTGKVIETTTDNSELSRELTEFLRKETLRADIAATDKNILLAFIKSNCGVGD